jgi:transcriptional regulator with XRE-family HTH domain
MKGRALVAWNLRRIRVRHGLSQERLAFDAGVDRSYVGGLERREENPTVDLLDRLARTLATISAFNRLAAHESTRLEWRFCRGIPSRCSLPTRNRALKSELATDALPIIRLRCRHHQVLNRETQSRYGNTRLILAAAGGTPAASRRRRQSPSSNAQAIEIGPSCCTNW